jgi:hypothetical protein
MAVHVGEKVLHSVGQVRQNLVLPELIERAVRRDLHFRILAGHFLNSPPRV